MHGGQARSSTTQMTARSSFGVMFRPFFLGSLSHLNEAPLQQGFNVMVTQRTHDVATQVFLLLLLYDLKQGWNLLFLSEILRVFEELNDIVFQCMGNREFDWSEIWSCHDNFITCHKKSAAVTNLRLSYIKIRLLFSYFS